MSIIEQVTKYSCYGAIWQRIFLLEYIGFALWTFNNIFPAAVMQNRCIVLFKQIDHFRDWQTIRRTDAHCLISEVSSYHHKMVLKLWPNHTESAQRVILHNPSSQYRGSGLLFGLFFSIWPFDGSWLISLVLPFAKMDDKQQEMQSGISAGFENLTFKTVKLPGARQFWLERIATAFYPEQMHTCLHLIEISFLPSVHAEGMKSM